MLSMASQMRFKAVGAPMVRSVKDMSLSMDPTRPTSFKWECASSWAVVILPMWVGSDGINGMDAMYLGCLDLG